MRTLKNYASTLLVACSLCFALTGCGANNNGSTSGNNDNNNTTADVADNVVDDIADGTGNAVEDAVDGVGNAVEDAADGVGNAVNDLVGNNGFDNYDDAHDYFLETMGNYHSDAKFEIRDEDRNLADYQEGSKGYRFHLYDTSKNADGEMFGEFYVDAASGTIFQKDASGNFTEYRGSAVSGTNTNAPGTTHNPANTEKNATSNGNSANNNTTPNNKTTNNASGNSATGNQTSNSGNISSVR